MSRTAPTQKYETIGMQIYQEDKAFDIANGHKTQQSKDNHNSIAARQEKRSCIVPLSKPKDKLEKGALCSK